MAINSWQLGVAQIPWPHPNSYAPPRCDPKTARLTTRNRLLNYFVRQPVSDAAPARLKYPRYGSEFSAAPVIQLFPSPRHGVPSRPHSFALRHPRPNFFRDRSFLEET